MLDVMVGVTILPTVMRVELEVWVPGPISRDLRERIVAARGDGLTYRRIAKSLRIGVASVSRILRLQRETGTVEPARFAGGAAKRLIKDSDLDTLHELIAGAPDQTLPELVDAFEAATGILMSRSTMGRTVRRAGYTRKKRPSGLTSRTVLTL